MRERNDRGSSSAQSSSAQVARTARLLAALHQAAAEHRVEPDEVPALWDWIVDDGARTPQQRDCMWDWIVCENSLSRPKRKPRSKKEHDELNQHRHQ